jgi:hypothetical protein
MTTKIKRQDIVYPDVAPVRGKREYQVERPIIGDRRERFTRAIEALTVNRDNADYRPARNTPAPIAGGPRSPVWAAQSGAAQSPFTGDRRVQAPPSFGAKVIAPTLAPANRRGRASVSDSPRCQEGPRAALRFASEARRARLANIPAPDEEEGATERPYPTVTPTPISISADPVLLEWNKQRQEAVTEAVTDAARRKALLPLPQAPKVLPRPARPGAPTPRHGIEGARSPSGRDLDPGRKR